MKHQNADLAKMFPDKVKPKRGLKQNWPTRTTSQQMGLQNENTNILEIICTLHLQSLVL